MIVTCPNCAQRAMLDDALLPKEGRQVRCIACTHIWRQARQDSPLQTDISLMGLHREIPLAYPMSKETSSRVLWFISFGLLVFMVSFLIIGRNLIVPLFPHLEKYYELLGMPVSLLGSGITISNATSHFHNEGDQDVILVSGDLVNASDRVRTIPPLKVTVVGDLSHPNCLKNMKEKRCILDQWDHRLSEKSLLPGEQIHFETTPHPKIEGTKHVSIEF